MDPSGHARKKIKSYRPKTGTKVWTCLKVTKKVLKNKIIPYYKHKPTKAALKDWLYDTIVSVPYDLVIERELDRRHLKKLCRVMLVWGYVETVYSIGNCIYEGKQHKIYKKIKNYYNKYLKNASSGKKVYFCAEASYRRKGSSSGAFLPTGNVNLTQKSHRH